MIDFFDKLYSSINWENRILLKLRIDSIFRFIIRLTSNIFIPIYFYFSSKRIEYKLIDNNDLNERIIVSFTSFPNRINRVWLVVESILRQSIKPDKIILWLSNEQFNSIDELPKRVLNLQKRGLEIQLRDGDLRSHKKYYYAIKEFSNDIIITVDDDVFYHTEAIKSLIDCHIKFPDQICCNLASKIIFDTNKQVMPYILWTDFYEMFKPYSHIMPIGMGGVLYPPKCLHPDVLNLNIFKELCLQADDIWLNVMSHLNNTKVVKTDFNSICLPVMNFKNMNLSTVNVFNGLNDIQILNLRNYYKQTKNVDPYFLADEI